MSKGRLMACTGLVMTLGWAPVVVAASLQADQSATDDVVAARDKAFEEMLSGVQLVGYFTMDDAPDRAPSEERYTITKVTRQRGDLWRFDTRVQYGERDVTLPIVVPVKWADDTPMVSLTNFGIPGLGTYSARVVFYDGKYAGMWRGGRRGGLMYGRIERLSTDPAADLPKPAADADKQASGHWPLFRGPASGGVARGHATATRWNVEKGENIAWKTPIPGLAHSSPVIWGDHLFVTTAVRQGEGPDELKVGLYGSIAPVPDDSVHAFKVYCLNKRTGEILWERTAVEAVPKIKRHPKGSHAASSPATDGRHVVALFASEGLYCYDVEGNLKWKRDLGVLDSGYYLVKDAQWGFASSPVIFENKVIIQCDVQENSFLAALDLETGETIWRTERTDVPTWGTPAIDTANGRRQVIVNGYRHIGGYHLDTGEPLWKLEGGGDIPVPTPVVWNSLVFITNAHGRMAPIYAIRLDAAKGDLSTEPDSGHLAWWVRSRGNYMQTPLVYDGLLYCCGDSGMLSCYRAETGDLLYRERVGAGQTGFTASIVAADGKIYITSEEGDIHVVRAGETFEIIASNEMGETCMASPAISEGVLYFRTRGHMVAVGAGEQGPR